MRFEIFKHSYETVKEQNLKYKHHQSTYKSALNNFSDKTPEELHKMMGVIMPPMASPPHPATTAQPTTTTTTTKEPEIEVDDEN